MSFMPPPPPTGLPPLRPAPHRRPADVLRIAHRGGGAKELYGLNDLLGVAAQGAHLVEVDLHVTGDDELVARHDPVVKMNGVPTWLADRRLDEVLPALECAAAHTAAAVVAAAKTAGVGLYLDLKSLTTRAAERLVALLEAENMTHRTILASVRSDIVARCGQVAPTIPRAVLFASTLEEPVQLAEAVDAQFVHPCWERLARPDVFLAGPWLDRVRAHGLGVICWHEERPEVLAGLCELGVDGICTDLPELLTRIANYS
jgi:glycerophosphoryl diester phosphodiesterase